MDLIEQENQRLCEEVIALKGEMERLTTMVTTLLAAQNQSSVPLPIRTAKYIFYAHFNSVCQYPTTYYG